MNATQEMIDEAESQKKEADSADDDVEGWCDKCDAPLHQGEEFYNGPLGMLCADCHVSKIADKPTD